MSLLRTCARFSCVLVMLSLSMTPLVPVPVVSATDMFEVAVTTSDGAEVPLDARTCLAIGSGQPSCKGFYRQDGRVFVDFMPFTSEPMNLTVTASGYEAFSGTYSGAESSYQVLVVLEPLSSPTPEPTAVPTPEPTATSIPELPNDPEGPEPPGATPNTDDPVPSPDARDDPDPAPLPAGDGTSGGAGSGPERSRPVEHSSRVTMLPSTGAGRFDAPGLVPLGVLMTLSLLVLLWAMHAARRERR